MCLLRVLTFDLVFYLRFLGIYWLKLMASGKFSFRTISRKAFAGLFSYCTPSCLRGCRCRCYLAEIQWLSVRESLNFELKNNYLIFIPFGGFDLIFYPRFLDLNWWKMITSVSRRYLAKRLLDCFPIAHPHSLGGVDVPFGGFDLQINFLPLILGHLSI